MRPAYRNWFCKGLALVSIAVCIAIAGAGPAPAATVRALTVPLAWNVGSGVGFRTAVLGPSGIRALTRTDWWGGSYSTQNGDSVRISISDSYPRDEPTAQRWAQFFGGLIHGPEIRLLSVYIAPLAEVEQLCSSELVLGCYGAQRLVTIGEPVDDVAPTEVASHEYGHHVAANRANTPWIAVDWGTKRWASYANVCARASAGTAYPGDEGLHYPFNPGEAFAESYRVLNELRSGATTFTWPIADSSFRPDANALAQVEQDVVAPWTAPSTSTRVGTFARGKPKIWQLPLTTPLDGDISVDVRMPAGAGYDVSLRGADGSMLARALWSASNVKSVTYRVCGRRTVLLRVARTGAAGRFRVTTTVP
jgi:hypothetical protein